MENNLYKYLEKFAKNLKIERLSRNLTQKELADSLGIKTQSYQAYEKGVALPSTENLVKISLVLEISIDDLFELSF